MALHKITIIAIILCVLIWVIGIGLIVWYKYKKRMKGWLFKKVPGYNDKHIKAYFLNSNGRISWDYYLMNQHNQIEAHNGRYNCDENCIKFEKNEPVIYFYKGIPDPINFTVEKKKVNIVIDSVTYDMVMKGKFIRDLITESFNQKMLMMLSIIIIVLLIVIGLKQFGILDQFMASTPK